MADTYFLHTRASKQAHTHILKDDKKQRKYKKIGEP